MFGVFGLICLVGLDELTKKEISLVLSKILRDRKYGCVIVRPDRNNYLIVEPKQLTLVSQEYKTAGAYGTKEIVMNAEVTGDGSSTINQRGR